MELYNPNEKEEIKELREKLNSLETKLNEKETLIKELRDKFENHRHTGIDNSQPLKEDITLDKGRGVQVGNAGFTSITLDEETINERDLLAWIMGRTQDKGLVKKSDNTQLTLEHQLNLEETFWYAFRPPLYQGERVNIVNGGNTLTQGRYKWETNEFIGVLGTPAIVNVYDSTGAFRQSKVIASNTESTLTISGTWNFTDSNCTYMVWKPVYFGSANFPFKRLYTAQNESGGIRFGLGPTVTVAGNADNGLLYMKSADGKLYWRGTDGVEKEIKFV